MGSEKLPELGRILRINLFRSLDRTENFLYPPNPHAFKNGDPKSLPIALALIGGSFVGMALSIPETGVIRYLVPDLPSLLVFTPTYFISTIAGTSLGYRIGCRLVS